MAALALSLGLGFRATSYSIITHPAPLLCLFEISLFLPDNNSWVPHEVEITINVPNAPIRGSYCQESGLPHHSLTDNSGLVPGKGFKRTRLSGPPTGLLLGDILK